MINIDFFFDFLSPFSFFAWKKLSKQLPEAKIQAYPVTMGKLFSHHGFPGPGEIPAKRNYELKKCFRYAATHEIDFLPPAQFPFNPLAVLKAATVHAAREKQHQVIEVIYHAIWQQGKVLEDPELVEKILKPIDESIFERSFEKEARSELKLNIKTALDHGAFGVPAMVYGKELFWGNDSIPTLKRVIEGNDNWNRELYDRLTTVPGQ